MSVRELMDATMVVVQRSPGFLWVTPRWDLVDAHELPLGQVVRRKGRRSGWGTRLSYDVTDTAAGALWRLDQRSGGSKSQFQLVDAEGVLAGTVVQENAWFAPQLRMTTAGGRVLRLDGGRRGSWQWTFVDLAGQGYGAMTLHSAGFGAFVSKQRTYVVERGERLDNELWPLAVVSSICLDIVHDRKASSGDGGAAAVG